MVKASRRLGLVLVLAVVYATCYSAIKVGLAYVPPFLFAGLRAVVGGAVLLGLVGVTGRPLLPPRRLWPGVVALAFSGTFLGFGAMFLSPGRTGAGIASVLGNTGPLFVVVLAALFCGEPVTRAKGVSLGLGLAGVTMIAYPAMVDPFRRGVLGMMLPLVAAVSTAAQSVIAKRLNIREALLSVTAWQFVLGGLPLLVLAAILERGAPVVWSPTFVSLFLYLTLLGTSTATALWFWLMQGDEVGRLTLQLFLVPVLGLLIATIVFREAISAIEAAGVAVVVFGISLIVRESWRAARQRAGAAHNLHHGMIP